jgi:hypothetical protein
MLSYLIMKIYEVKNLTGKIKPHHESRRGLYAIQPEQVTG